MTPHTARSGPELKVLVEIDWNISDINKEMRAKIYFIANNSKPEAPEGSKNNSLSQN